MDPRSEVYWRRLLSPRPFVLRNLRIISASLCLAACSGPLTQLVVVVDTDVPVPAELDAFRITVDENRAVESSEAALSGPRAIARPAVISLVHRGGELGPVGIVVEGRLGADVRVERRVTTSFVRGRALVLPIFLSQACLARTCAGGETCIDGACAPPSVDPVSLIDWTGSPPRFDGAAPMVDAGPYDAGLEDDAGQRDAGQSIDAGRDAGRDAGPPSCDERFGDVPDYIFCSQTSTSCTFNATTGGGDCNALCASFGSSCVSANYNDTMSCVVTATGTCATTGGDMICTCAR